MLKGLWSRVDDPGGGEKPPREQKRPTRESISLLALPKHKTREQSLKLSPRPSQLSNNHLPTIGAHRQSQNLQLSPRPPRAPQTSSQRSTSALNRDSQPPRQPRRSRSARTKGRQFRPAAPGATIRSAGELATPSSTPPASSDVDPRVAVALSRVDWSWTTTLKKLGLSEGDIEDLLPCFRFVSYVKGHYVFREGDPGDRFYIIISGSCAVIINKSSPIADDTDLAALPSMAPVPVKVGTMKVGTSFGEKALLHNTPRTATIQAQEPLELIYLSNEQFQENLASQHARAERRKMQFLEGIPAFNGYYWSNERRKKVVESLVFKYYQKGDYILNQGADAQGVAFVKSGKCEVICDVTALVTDVWDAADPLMNIRRSTSSGNLTHKKQAAKPVLVLGEVKAGQWHGVYELLPDHDSQKLEASMVAVSDNVEVAFLDRFGFLCHIDQYTRLLMKDECLHRPPPSMAPLEFLEQQRQNRWKKRQDEKNKGDRLHSSSYRDVVASSASDHRYCNCRKCSESRLHLAVSLRNKLQTLEVESLRARGMEL